MCKHNSEFLTLIIIFMVLLNLIVLTVCSASVQAVAKPSVPQFNVKFIDNSYYVPPIQTSDPYTGTTITKPGYLVNDMRIDITIKNQRFTPYTDALGRECNLYYRVEVKGHFEEGNWRAFSYQYYNHYADPVSFVVPSGSEYTVVSSETRYDVGSQLDFRVKAFTGYWVEPTMGDHAAGFHDPRLVEAETSSWSNIQTIVINYGILSPLPSQTTVPPELTAIPDNLSQTNLMILIVSTCIIITILIMVIVYLLKQRKCYSLNDTGVSVR